jgi:neutral ceramidase
MVEKAREVRLGLVLYGGVSLAVYIHGVCRELFELVRGRGAYGPLKRFLDADVVVDIISGTSAGGINGIFLARALAAHGDFAKCATMWREHGDILDLLNRPLDATFENGATSPPSLLRSEVHYEQKLREVMTQLGVRDAEVLPDESRVAEIDAFVTGTHFHGHTWQEQDDRDAVIDVREHRAVFHLKHRLAADDTVRKSAFVEQSDENGYPEQTVCRGLARIARATSAFPFAFRPVRHESKSDDVGRMLHDTLGEQVDADEVAWFVDGGVLDNKPFSHTLREIAYRAADREVVRKILYVEPDPEQFQRSPGTRPEPGAEETAIAALLSIPRYESIASDLQAIRDRNERVRRFRRLAKEILNGEEERVARGDKSALAYATDDDYFVELARENPTAMRVYVRARATALRELLLPHLRREHQKLTQALAASDVLPGDLDRKLQKAADEWIGAGGASLIDELQAYLPLDVEYHLRRHFHAVYRAYEYVHAKRQDETESRALRGSLTTLGLEQAKTVLRFLYRQIERLQAAQVTVERVVRLAARKLIESLTGKSPQLPLEALRELAGKVRAALVLPDGVRQEVGDLMAAADFETVLRDLYGRLRAQAEQQVAAGSDDHRDSVHAATSRETDSWLANPPSDIPPTVVDVVRRALAEFPLVDLHLFPLQLMSGVMEQDEIGLIRVSPIDTNNPAGLAARLGKHGATKVSGDSFFHFGGFFQRSWRSNDILWGRLDAAEVLVDALMSKDTWARISQQEEQLEAHLGRLHKDLSATIVLAPDAFAKGPGQMAAVKAALMHAMQRGIVLEAIPDLAFDRVLDEQEARAEGKDTLRATEERNRIRTALATATKESQWLDVVRDVVRDIGSQTMRDVAISRVLGAALGAGILIDRRIGGHLERGQFLGAGLARTVRGYVAMPMRVLYCCLALSKAGRPFRSWLLATFLMTFLLLSGLALAHAVTRSQPVGGWILWVPAIVAMFGLLILFGRDYRLLVRSVVAIAVAAMVATTAYVLVTKLAMAPTWIWIGIASATCLLGFLLGFRRGRTGSKQHVTVLLALTLLPVIGCQSTETVTGTLPRPTAPVAHGCMRGGAATVDITPEPGFPLGGHSIAGSLGRGVWTRLRARCLYFEDETGSPLVMCACELWSISGSLVDRVAELVGENDATRHIGRDRIVLGATHTHHGPAAFTAHTVYATNAGRLAGFDPDLHELLARRIAHGIVQAVRGAEPVQLHHGAERLAGIQRNRSFAAFQLDPEAGSVLAENWQLPLGEVDDRYPQPEAWRAVDPAVRVLAMTANGGRLLGAAAFAALHPTAMRAVTEAYHGDLFGVAAIEAANELRGTASTAPTIALFNGAEGDVSPLWRHQDRIDVVTNGRRLAAAIVAATRTATPLAGRLPIAGAFATVPLANANWQDDAGSHSTAPRPVPGAGQLGGAEDGRTFLHDLGWIEGVRGIRHQGESSRGHGNKLPAFEPALDLVGMAPVVDWLLGDLTATLADPATFPKEVPLAVYRIGDLWFATLPGEFTTVMGRRAANAVAKQVGVPRTNLHLIGLANEYVSYFVTPEEYEAQHYEGASTLYGASSGPWIAHNLRQLAGKVTVQSPPFSQLDFAYAAKPGRRFGLDDLGERPLRHDDGLDSLLVDAQHWPRRNRPHLEWTQPRGPGCRDLGVRESGVPFVRVRNSRQELVAAADGIDLVTVALACTGTAVHWTVIWLADVVAPGEYHFFVVDADGNERPIGSCNHVEEGT